MNTYSQAVRYLTVAFISLASLGAQETRTKPENYEEIKSIWHSPSRGKHQFESDSWKLLSSKGVEAIPALLFLYEEDGESHGAIVHFIRYGKSSKEAKRMGADFLAKQFETHEEKVWYEQQWIDNLLEVLAETDPERARHLAWKALSSPHLATGAAYAVLGKVGTMEDAKHLKEWKLQGKITDLTLDEVGIDKAMELIALRMENPQDFKEIQSTLDAYELSMNMMTSELIAVRKSLHSSGDDPVQDLLLLFEQQNAEDWWRRSIVNAIQRYGSQEAKKIAAAFLEKYMESGAVQWNDDKLWNKASWIMDAIRFFTEADPERARRVAHTALHSLTPQVREVAAKSLKEIGTKEDVERLEAMIAQQEAEQGKETYDQSLHEARKAIKQITLREARPQDYSDIRAMLDAYGFITHRRGGLDRITQELLDARESFRAKGDDPIHAMLFLFEKNDDSSIRAAIIEAIDLMGSEKAKRVAADYFAGKYLEINEEKWYEEEWGYRVIGLLGKSDTEQSRRALRKAWDLFGMRPYDRSEALKAFEEIGTMEDVEVLKELIIPKEQRENENTFPLNDNSYEALKQRTRFASSDQAEKVIEKIKEREEKSKNKK